MVVLVIMTKTTYDISLDSQISLLPLGFSLLLGIVVVAVVKEGESATAVTRTHIIHHPLTAKRPSTAGNEKTNR